ncbi:hypothetical protein PC119_g14779 [Phytophthora cactorum]|uniref:Uncharacterized protein n=1 Tax=Phytophthora cactorum TaxID=29920 RepID=A0A8T0YST3_9STRA|nr:hypothetical protein PC111_g16511 [Phytophthora cactorum]KAG2853382.1 hypothetical protein PC113_g14211 [Phytophthora cactorum]KAG2886415.1 hypothetical protein PC114_g19279 [Phytophthora cactorum]KAG2927772.1 hypothetical protein PC117_g14496 [Phytophthora cactorum]KAG3006918.1 hypothetical protein PC119_g14779 [Phytophthora cactorum]
MMAAEKDRNKTWLEHYQFLVYVAERSGNTEQSVLECLCKSAPAYIQTAMLTRLNTQRGCTKTLVSNSVRAMCAASLQFLRGSLDSVTRFSIALASISWQCRCWKSTLVGRCSRRCQSS